ncbi:uncharacterized protein LACBIDRAFT_331075 [Laccaria bicolor S238N-H82]|uniref:Predicted protein n=1 Tax=Laccaria bicolor (strain S238N-H82 / ATCC MYA-4686) TaxID=486041 RepID=B0DND4_LACBS|nr:uncharacterized protein LACBIDRAFT_331072 [Laccaria bicolor S238N-H82]XP_001885491.1 uncharacterized protein LACBIDRAFT_331075 [Laccaria bicolor S238N-H82]EDR03921.1 predicted protein [Laccaria bicolor S238N-H82]EDR03923.1 predicted protein [Laccaria bicolor S238N-H82]|eukprot:XP_001885489.1 predicted protein [Laccaria bicolor S238N-H82]
MLRQQYCFRGGIRMLECVEKMSQQCPVIIETVMNDVVRQLVDLPSTSTKRPTMSRYTPDLCGKAYQFFRDGAVMTLIALVIPFATTMSRNSAANCPSESSNEFGPFSIRRACYISQEQRLWVGMGFNVVRKERFAWRGLWWACVCLELVQVAFGGIQGGCIPNGHIATTNDSASTISLKTNGRPRTP